MSVAPAPVRRRGRRAGWTSVRRSAVVALWQVVPWAVVVLVVAGVLGGGSAAWSTWSAVHRGATVVVGGDGGVATAVSFFVGVATLFGWVRAVPAALPVLVAGGATRRATTGGLLAGALSLAAALTGVLALVALAGAALQRSLSAAAPAARPSSGSDAYSSTLTLTYDAPEAGFAPAETFRWLVVVALVGLLLGAARYRWRAPGVVGVLVVAAGAWATYLSVVQGYSVDGTTTSPVDLAPLTRTTLWLVPCLGLAAAVWLALRRVPLRPPAR